MRTSTADDLITQQCGFTKVPIKPERFAVIELDLSKLGLNVELLGRGIKNLNRD